ncbi:hypothetical protein HHK36_000346 [Tetracentron sinense]|uniref:Pentatricopeptide repeat-containing protein n=1 Tax=Tetracentron sinense TaxID=13715 RepID=A0A835DTX4_TETSI|nr:hypothetical protein HHK36_000346 [Tetracentron sinense]
MKGYGLVVDQYTFGSILKGVAFVALLDLGQQVHSIIVKMGYENNVFSGSAHLDMYAKYNRVEDAYAVFQCIPEHNSISWNTLIAGNDGIGSSECFLQATLFASQLVFDDPVHPSPASSSLS